MEAYGKARAATGAVIAFLGAWDRQVTAAGYVTGVYSSQDSGIPDMQAAVTAETVGFTSPDALWIALWNDNPTLRDGNLRWPHDERSKQYGGTPPGTSAGSSSASTRTSWGAHWRGDAAMTRRSRGMPQ